MKAERIRALLRVDTDQVVEQHEDSDAVLDEGDERQRDLLAQLRRVLADVSSARKRIELQGEDLAAGFDRLADQAQLAMFRHREDLARTALERRAVLERTLGALRRQYATIHQQERRLQADERRIAAFRARKETPSSTLTAAAGRGEAREGPTGTAPDFGLVSRDLARARGEVLRTQAHVAATDELIAGGVVPGPAAADGDLEHRLAAARTTEEIERQLQALRQRNMSRSADGHGNVRPDALALGRDA